MSSGDLKDDADALQEFVSKYDEMNRWVSMTDGTEILKIGADNYPFPIPLRQNSSSKWFFDTHSGADEILARRIGRNELLAIDAICAIAYAEDIYARTSHDGNPAGPYTTKILSTPGKQDKYGESGIMTFIINQEGDVYQQDLGKQTSKVTASIREYNPTAEWEVVE